MSPEDLEQRYADIVTHFDNLMRPGSRSDNFETQDTVPGGMPSPVSKFLDNVQPWVSPSYHEDTSASREEGPDEYEGNACQQKGPYSSPETGPQLPSSGNLEAEHPPAETPSKRKVPKPPPKFQETAKQPDESTQKESSVQDSVQSLTRTPQIPSGVLQQLASQQMRISELERDLEAKNRALLEHEEQLRSVADTQNQLESEIEKLRVSEQNATQQAATLRQDLMISHNACCEADSRAASILSQLTQAQNLNEHLKANSSSNVDEVVELHRQLGESKTAAAIAQEEVQSLHQELRASEARCLSATTDLTAAHREMGESAEKASAVAAECESLEKKLQESQMQYSAAQAQIEDLQQKLVDAGSRLDTALNDLEMQCCKAEEAAVKAQSAAEREAKATRECSAAIERERLANSQQLEWRKAAEAAALLAENLTTESERSSRTAATVPENSQSGMHQATECQDHNGLPVPAESPNFAQENGVAELLVAKIEQKLKQWGLHNVEGGHESGGAVCMKRKRNMNNSSVETKSVNILNVLDEVLAHEKVLMKSNEDACVTRSRQENEIAQLRQELIDSNKQLEVTVQRMNVMEAEIAVLRSVPAGTQANGETKRDKENQLECQGQLAEAPCGRAWDSQQTQMLEVIQCKPITASCSAKRDELLQQLHSERAVTGTPCRNEECDDFSSTKEQVDQLPSMCDDAQTQRLGKSMCEYEPSCTRAVADDVMVPSNKATSLNSELDATLQHIDFPGCPSSLGKIVSFSPEPAEILERKQGKRQGRLSEQSNAHGLSNDEPCPSFDTTLHDLISRLDEIQAKQAAALAQIANDSEGPSRVLPGQCSLSSEQTCQEENRVGSEDALRTVISVACSSASRASAIHEKQILTPEHVYKDMPSKSHDVNKLTSAPNFNPHSPVPLPLGLPSVAARHRVLQSRAQKVSESSSSVASQQYAICATEPLKYTPVRRASNTSNWMIGTSQLASQCSGVRNGQTSTDGSIPDALQHLRRHEPLNVHLSLDVVGVQKAEECTLNDVSVGRSASAPPGVEALASVQGSDVEHPPSLCQSPDKATVSMPGTLKKHPVRVDSPASTHRCALKPLPPNSYTSRSLSTLDTAQRHCSAIGRGYYSQAIREGNSTRDTSGSSSVASTVAKLPSEVNEDTSEGFWSNGCFPSWAPSMREFNNETAHPGNLPGDFASFCYGTHRTPKGEEFMHTQTGMAVGQHRIAGPSLTPSSHPLLRNHIMISQAPYMAGCMREHVIDHQVQKGSRATRSARAFAQPRKAGCLSEQTWRRLRGELGRPGAAKAVCNLASDSESL